MTRLHAVITRSIGTVSRGALAASIGALLACGLLAAPAFADTSSPEDTSTASAIETTTEPAVEKATKKKAEKDIKITVSAAGDCTLGSGQGFPSNNLNAVYNSVGSPAYFLKNVKKIFAKDDLTIVNLEGTLTTRGTPAAKTFTFRGKPSYTKILKKGSVEMVGFANNHDHDYGQVSYNDTVKHVKKSGIKLASYGKVCTYKVKGVIIGLVACSTVSPSYGDAYKNIREGLAKLKKKGCKIRIVYMHSGIERDHYPTGGQKSLAHYAVDHGADLVLGAHPHVLQGIERYKGVTCAYSLANFCFGGNTNPSDKDTMILQKTFTIHKGKLVKDKKVKVIPCRVSSKTYTNDYRPTPLKGSAKARVLGRINTYSKTFKVKFDSKGKMK